jgi:hypothetical protein
MHLLARRRFAVYEKHLRGPGSVIAVHISNQTLDLRPELAGVAQKSGFHALHIYRFFPVGALSQSDGILLAHDPGSLSGEELGKESELFPAETRRIFWTDDYCDLLHVLWRQN